jgi:hypothetical protein
VFRSIRYAQLHELSRVVEIDRIEQELRRKQSFRRTASLQRLKEERAGEGLGGEGVDVGPLLTPRTPAPAPSSPAANAALILAALSRSSSQLLVGTPSTPREGSGDPVWRPGGGSGGSDSGSAEGAGAPRDARPEVVVAVHPPPLPVPEHASSSGPVGSDGPGEGPASEGVPDPQAGPGTPRRTKSVAMVLGLEFARKSRMGWAARTGRMKS